MFGFESIGQTAGGHGCENCPKLLARFHSLRQSAVIGMALREVVKVEGVMREFSLRRGRRHDDIDGYDGFEQPLWNCLEDIEGVVSPEAFDYAHKIRKLRNSLCHDSEFLETLTATEYARMRDWCKVLIDELQE